MATGNSKQVRAPHDNREKRSPRNARYVSSTSDLEDRDVIIDSSQGRNKRFASIHGIEFDRKAQARGDKYSVDSVRDMMNDQMNLKKGGRGAMAVIANFE